MVRSNTRLQDIWLDFLIGLENSWWQADAVQGMRRGQAFFNLLPNDIARIIRGTPCDPFNWSDDRWNRENPILVDKIGHFVMTQDIIDREC